MASATHPPRRRLRCRRASRASRAPRAPPLARPRSSTSRRASRRREAQPRDIRGTRRPPTSPRLAPALTPTTDVVPSASHVWPGGGRVHTHVRERRATLIQSRADGGLGGVVRPAATGRAAARYREHAHDRWSDSSTERSEALYSDDTPEREREVERAVADMGPRRSSRASDLESISDRHGSTYRRFWRAQASGYTETYITRCPLSCDHSTPPRLAFDELDSDITSHCRYIDRHR
jgi:hypothetical protein